jgi:hypothetical protein
MSSARGDDVSPELKRIIENETDAQVAAKTPQQQKYELIVQRKQREIQCYLAATVLRLDRVNLALKSRAEFENQVDDYYERVTAFLMRDS